MIASEFRAALSVEFWAPPDLGGIKSMTIVMTMASYKSRAHQSLDLLTAEWFVNSFYQLPEVASWVSYFISWQYLLTEQSHESTRTLVWKLLNLNPCRMPHEAFFEDEEIWKHFQDLMLDAGLGTELTDQLFPTFWGSVDVAWGLLYQNYRSGMGHH